MSYVLQTSNGKVIVIDGGNTGDAPYLKGFLAALGNHVHAWFISHQHPDHADALTAILNDLDNLEIDRIYGSMLDENWVTAHARPYLKTTQELNLASRKSKREVIELSIGQQIELDGIRMEVLGIKNPEIRSNAINNSSIVVRISDASKSVLFLGDLGTEGGEKLLQSPYSQRIRSDYVQMAHHGQNGVSEAFYRAVQPTYCLWPTPQWLWDNDSGGGKGSGPWLTLTVRKWMEELDVRENYVSRQGLIRID